ncbi:glycolate oxidase [Coccomyxa subellipsoidea C-169]|uniref:Glycolate oxidase n=1 Tax=Coccomyxa subellipsoidea (strain C-169) TaxID=574566 RepID=I0Z2R2_COCSC|nr:glycolate oxidase [Coccomyxa subellipsoidea C-169]EIE24931.1 glycolate oxidase [Coccomyxa subellipsoidea C-169]|eukprot:XP_005649475.1 glycolate oxidase [Coccomyxa subellipsoidea C-169]
MSELFFQNLDELEPLAEQVLPKTVFGYYASGSETESTLRDNRAVFSRYRLMPRMMVDVSNVDTTCTLLGRELAYPVLIAPMAMQCMAHPDGELAVSRAAAAEGIPMVQSTMGTVGLADVRQAGAGGPLMFFQLYVFKNRAFVRQLVQHAERSGYNGLMVTVDAPFLGKREADERNNFKLPDGLRLANLEGLGANLGKETASNPSFNPVDANSVAGAATRDAAVHDAGEGSGVSKHFSDNIDASLTWAFVAWLRSVTSLPIFVKGILSAADAERGVDAGVDGIVVSNHGGRQLDTAPASLDALPAVAAAVGKRVPVLMDGGIRRGTDIIKALALGADAVLLGRPVLWGLALGGQQGVQKVLETLRKELRLSMALMGCPSLAHLNRRMVLVPWEHPSARL